MQDLALILILVALLAAILALVVLTGARVWAELQVFFIQKGTLDNQDKVIKQLFDRLKHKDETIARIIADRKELAQRLLLYEKPPKRAQASRMVN